MKLQETPDSVATGEMPRSIILTADRYLVEKAPPGTRVIVVGIFSTFSSNKGSSKSVAYPYIRVLGIEVNNMGAGRSDFHFDKEEEDKFRKFARTPGLYDKISANIDPAIYGHEDIKQAIACQLFGGSRKTLPDGIKRRGDINVLLLGDPSTAKSQLLKFTEKVAPIAVYTSGKGSSAAGLTACIIKERGTGEYYLEGGSMVLADGGIVCIDEFDKMRDQDRVAIHEAMEQQTISIAKAGITTVLNSRTAVLAAANPVYGRYDDTKTAEEQIDFQTTILSRFDMIFIVRDTKDRAKDIRMADHVLNIHKNARTDASANQGEISIEYMKRYVSYCRKICHPVLSEEASQLLVNYYVTQRSRNRGTNDSMPVIPITVRQLEALIRISEGLAKMVLSDVATAEHAREAIKLFTSSTVDAINSGQAGDISSMSEEMSREVQKAEDMIKQKLPIGTMMNQEALIALLQRSKCQRAVVERAVYIMTMRREVEMRQKRRCIYRLK
jgi:DNA replication licensing factor MCM5